MAVQIVKDVELHACPFCGHKANLKTDKYNNQTDQFWAKCSNKECGVSTMAKRDQDVAIGLWNDRVK